LLGAAEQRVDGSGVAEIGLRNKQGLRLTRTNQRRMDKMIANAFAWGGRLGFGLRVQGELVTPRGECLCLARPSRELTAAALPKLACMKQNDIQACL